MFKIKTLIELFDEVAIENVVAGLRFKPERIVYIGFDQMMTTTKKKALNEFFSSREENIELKYEPVEKYDYDDIYATLNRVLDENEDCCFDLTGGKELVVAAMGAISALRNIPMFQINVRTGNFIRVKNCEKIVETEKSHLNIEESVKLNGCCISHVEKDDYRWKLTSDFRRDLQIMWDICRRNCSAWNYQSMVFDGFEKLCPDIDDLRVVVDLHEASEMGLLTSLNPRIINALVMDSLIIDYKSDNEVISFRYKNDQVRRCITKAGNILELYVYMLLNEIEEENRGYYDDIDIGVYIDWDGVLHGENDKVKDTKNEVDIMVMRDLVPIFISCKNGEVHKEALYELSVVADKFGGRYAKKILLTTYVNSDRLSSKYVLRRSKDMRIDTIEGVHDLTRQEFKNLLKNRIKQ